MGFLQGAKEFFVGKPGQVKRMKGVPSDAFSQAGDYYKGLLSNQSSDFDAMAAPELRRFNQEIIPNLSEQFAGMGSGGAVGGSGFQNAASTAATDLSERLGALRARLRESAAQGLVDLGSRGQYYEQGQPGLIDLLGPVLGAAGSYYGGEGLGKLGKAVGGAVSSKFGASGRRPQLGFDQAGLYPQEGNYNPYTGNEEERASEKSGSIFR